MPDGSVYASYIHGDSMSFAFHLSMVRLLMFDLHHEQRIPRGGHAANWAGAGRIADARNECTAKFLTESDADWLWWVDTDMVFPPDLIERLVRNADPDERPVVGGLCFAQMPGDVDPEMAVPTLSAIPTIYAWDDTRGMFVNATDFPDNALVRCDATGAACLLIHRGVIERVRDEHGPNWFTQIPTHNDDGTVKGVLSEDFSFCLRLRDMGVPVHVHTGAALLHHKSHFVGRDAFRRQVGPVPPAGRVDALLSEAGR